MEDAHCRDASEPAIGRPLPDQEACITALWALVGRRDAYARQNADGTYTAIREPVTQRLLRAHMDGEVTIAAYPIREDGTCALVALDWDDVPLDLEYRWKGGDLVGADVYLQRYPQIADAIIHIEPPPHDELR